MKLFLIIILLTPIFIIGNGINWETDLKKFEKLVKKGEKSEKNILIYITDVVAPETDKKQLNMFEDRIVEKVVKKAVKLKYSKESFKTGKYKKIYQKYHLYNCKPLCTIFPATNRYAKSASKLFYKDNFPLSLRETLLTNRYKYYSYNRKHKKSSKILSKLLKLYKGDHQKMFQICNKIWTAAYNSGSKLIYLKTERCFKKLLKLDPENKNYKDKYSFLLKEMGGKYRVVSNSKKDDKKGVKNDQIDKKEEIKKDTSSSAVAPEF